MSSVVSGPELRAVTRLLRARWRMLLNRGFRESRAKRGVTTVVLIGGAGLEWLSFRSSRALLGYRGAPPAHDPIVAGAIAMLIGFVAATSVTFALSSLYFASDMELLLQAPLRPRVILMSRLLTQLALGLAIAALIAGPPLIAYLLSIGAVAMLPLMVVTLLCAAALPMSLAMALVVVGLRMVPARMARDAGGLVVGLVVVMVAAINIAARGPGGLGGPPAQLPLASFGRTPLTGAWSPIGWGVRSVSDALRGHWLEAAGWAAPVALCGAAVSVAVCVGIERAFVTGWQRNAIAAPAKGRRRAARRRTARWFRVPAWLVIAHKDLRQVRRDPSQLGQLIIPLVLFAVYLGTPGHVDTAGSPLPWWFLLSLNAAFASLLFATNIALRGVGLEGSRMWLLRVPPIGARQVLAAKFASGFVVAAVPACLLFWIGALRSGHGVFELLPPTLFVLVLVAGTVALAVSVGSIRPRLDWTDPRRAVGLGTTITFLLAGAVLLMVSYVVMGAPYAFARGSAAAVATAAAVLLLLLGTTSALGLGVAAARLRRLEP